MVPPFENDSLESDNPDFSHVDSRAKAEVLFHRGELEKLLLLPLEFGGEDSPDNTVFVPLGVVEIKANIDNEIIAPLVEDGEVSQYSVSPEYQGNSSVPIALKIIASDPAEFSTTINIWGEALSRE